MEKDNLIGREVIVCNGDFRGVRGILTQITIETNTFKMRGSRGEIVKTFETTPPDFICSIYVNNKNTITVMSEDITKVE